MRAVRILERQYFPVYPHFALKFARTVELPAEQTLSMLCAYFHRKHFDKTGYSVHATTNSTNSNIEWKKTTHTQRRRKNQQQRWKWIIKTTIREKGASNRMMMVIFFEASNLSWHFLVIVCTLWMDFHAPNIAHSIIIDFYPLDKYRMSCYLCWLKAESHDQKYLLSK